MENPGETDVKFEGCIVLSCGRADMEASHFTGWIGFLGLPCRCDTMKNDHKPSIHLPVSCNRPLTVSYMNYKSHLLITTPLPPGPGASGIMEKSNSPNYSGIQS